jgi:hypothetical protein
MWDLLNTQPTASPFCSLRNTRSQELLLTGSFHVFLPPYCLPLIGITIHLRTGKKKRILQTITLNSVWRHHAWGVLSLTQCAEFSILPKLTTGMVFSMGGKGFWSRLCYRPFRHVVYSFSLSIQKNALEWKGWMDGSSNPGWVTRLSLTQNVKTDAGAQPRLLQWVPA